MNVDPKCLELAYHFLADHPNADSYDAQEMAERLQATAEDFLEVAFAHRPMPEDKLMPNDKGEQFAPIKEEEF